MAHAQADLAELRRRIARLERQPARLMPDAADRCRNNDALQEEQGQQSGAGKDGPEMPPGPAPETKPAGAGKAARVREVNSPTPRPRFDAGLGEVQACAGGETGLENGLARGALHEIASDETRQAGGASGFALALATRLAQERPGALLWVCDATVPGEAGALNAEGLFRFGLDPRRVIEVRTHTPADSLWVLEEGMGCSALVAVVGEFLQAPRALTLTATRRLALRAGASGVTGFLVNHAAPPAPSAAASRWRVRASPGGPAPAWQETPPPLAGMAGLGRPAWHVRLEKNRDGRPAIFDLEWDCDERIFRPATHCEPLAAPPFHRPDRPQDGPDNAATGTDGTGTGELIRLRFGERRF